MVVRRWLCCTVMGVAACTSQDARTDANALAWDVLTHGDTRGMFMQAWAPENASLPYIVGGSLSQGGVLLKALDGGSFERVPLPREVPILTWMTGSSDDDMWVVGLYGTVFHRDDKGWHDLSVPIESSFWGVVEHEGMVYAVGGPFKGVGDGPVLYRGGVQGLTPVAVPKELVDRGALFKVAMDLGGYRDRACAVGASGAALCLDAQGDAYVVPTKTAFDLVTLAPNHAGHMLGVGGNGSIGGIMEMTADGAQYQLLKQVISPLSGVAWLDETRAIVVGARGYAAIFEPGTGLLIDRPLPTADLLHNVWVSHDGQVWAVGGNWETKDFSGIIGHARVGGE